MQTLKEKPKQTKPLRVAIVGARSSKWTKEQVPKVKDMISYILENLKHNLVTTFDQPTKGLTTTKDVHERPIIGNSEIVIISGRCPVGEERWFDMNNNCWVTANQEIGYVGLKSPLEISHFKYVRVYNKGGVDTWVEIICAKLGIKTEIYPAPAMQWEDKKDVIVDLKTAIPEHLESGYYNLREPTPRILPHLVADITLMDLRGYRSRNIKIAEACNILYDLEPKGSCNYCLRSGPNDEMYQGENNTPCPKCEGDGSYGGGTWTLKEARKRGKEVYKIIIQ